MMNDKEIQKLIELAEVQMQQRLSREEAIASLVAAGLLDQNGHPMPPYQALAPEQA